MCILGDEPGRRATSKPLTRDEARRSRAPPARHIEPCDASTGALNLIAGGFASPQGAFSVAVDPSGKYVYVAGGFEVFGIERDAVVVLRLEAENLGGDVLDGVEKLTVTSQKEGGIGTGQLDFEVGG